MKGQDLGVLRLNPPRYILQVERRNLAHEDHIWAIRYDKLRQRGAEKVVKALLDELGRYEAASLACIVSIEH